MDVLLQNVKFKKKIELVFQENQVMKESIKELTKAMESLKETIDKLKRDSREIVSEDNILETLEYAIARAREFESMEGE
ncbi:hypothetical protein COL48_28725 [Bacillus toyonensis]|uniref:hypothetical protein n=1 Tax=Bacillus cereus group TaxID=86661 RepID=UPI000B830CC9|nr:MULTISPECIES: hypothetical protein [Bacillus cereus group]PEC60925.1 hypothetical protein CON62_31320 [Bacillus toyonensis]PEM53627.1 hypothetical protein CN625_30745 [Bacillus toyonensis]PEN72213.1 hypothetical protein CN539_20840 [Bacillus toyonensis]PEN79686.1 hypothetical protein CN544_21470 [Bacillus toyonensis]PFY28687.1 hypothetical protein COL48_28725 [Bacillus toyonensis]